MSSPVAASLPSPEKTSAWNKPTHRVALKPIQNYVLLKPLPGLLQEDGFVVPDSAKREEVAEVLEVGPGLVVDGVLVPCIVKKGDLVLAGQYSRQEFVINREKVWLCRDEDCKATVQRVPV